MVPKESIASKLISFRKKNRITQKQLAEMLNISRSAISLYEMGAREPDAQTILRIAELLRIPLEELLGITGSVHEKAQEYSFEASIDNEIPKIESLHQLVDIIWEQKKAGFVSDDDLLILNGILKILGRKGQGAN